MRLLSDDELHALRPSETASFPGPIPTQIVSNDEFVPLPYADLGQISAQSTVADPRLCAAAMRQLVQGLSANRVVWGADAVWTGSPQWQIEALRRLEIPEEMQKKHGFKPLGPADGPLKNAIVRENNARLYKYEKRTALATDRLSAMKLRYERAGAQRSNLRYGYVAG